MDTVIRTARRQAMETEILMTNVLVCASKDLKEAHSTSTYGSS